MKMNETVFFSLIMLLSVFVSSCSQIALKKASLKSYPNRIKEYLNMTVAFAYFIFFFATLITLLALKYIPLSYAPVLDSCGYIFVTILGATILKEKINLKKGLGMLIIVIGVLLFTI